MSKFNEEFLLLRQACESSPSFMLIKALNGEHGALEALMIFDEIADYPPDVASDKGARSQIVTDLLTRAVSAKADEIRAVQGKENKNKGA